MANLMKRNLGGYNISSHGGAWRGAAWMFRAAALPTAVFLAGCQSSGPQDVTGSIGTASQPHGAELVGDKQRAAEAWGRQYDRHPDDKSTALNYALALRGAEEYAQAAAVLQRLAIKLPRDT